MTILMINFEYPPLGGGGGVATKQLAEALAARHRVVVLTTYFKGLTRQEERGNLQIRRVKVFGRSSLPTASLVSLISFVPAAVFAGWRLSRRQKFSIINAQFVIPSGLVGALLARLMNAPLVVSFIGGDLFDPSKGTSPHRHGFLRALVRWVSRQAQARTAISEDTVRQARELHGVRGDITVTHLGIEPWRAQPIDRAALAVPERVPVFISVGRLIPRKNYEVLLAAWREVREAHLLILGNGPLLDKLTRLAREYDLEERVHFRGFVSEADKRALLTASDGYVAATDHEGFGLVFLEAMQAGLPIVATNRGGQRDFLTHGEQALLVNPGDAAGIARAVNRLLREPNLVQQMSAHNREAVGEFYLGKTVPRFEQVLAGAVQAYARRD